MATANEMLSTASSEVAFRGSAFRVHDNPAPTGPATLFRSVRSGLLEFLDIAASETCQYIETAGRGSLPAGNADVVVADPELVLLGEPEVVARELLQACRPGGRIGIACAIPGSFIAGVQERIRAYAAPVGSFSQRGFTGTREALDRLFGAHAIALGARDTSVTLSIPSVELWLATWQAHYAPLKTAYGKIDPDWRPQLTRDLVGIAKRHATPHAGKLSIRCDFIEFVVHTGSLQ